MRRTVREYAGMNIEDIKACIEGDPEIASKRVNPGETNETEQIQGLSVKDKKQKL